MNKRFRLLSLKPDLISTGKHCTSLVAIKHIVMVHKIWSWQQLRTKTRNFSMTFHHVIGKSTIYFLNATPVHYWIYLLSSRRVFRYGADNIWITTSIVTLILTDLKINMKHLPSKGCTKLATFKHKSQKMLTGYH